MTSKSSASPLKAFLKPIPGSNPSGVYLHYDETYDLIRAARVEEDETLPQGVWQRELREADWKTVEEISTQALQSKTKDLQIVGWLAEAWLQREGITGFHRGVQLMTQLVEAFWETLYPELSEDIEFRLSPFLWMNDKLSARFLTLSLAAPQDSKTSEIFYHDWVRFQKKPSEALATKLGKGILDTEKSFYTSLKTNIQATLKSVIGLESSLTERLKEADGSLYKLKALLQDLIGFTEYALKQFPHSEDLPHPSQENNNPVVKEESSMSQTSSSAKNPPKLEGQIESRDQAYQILEQVAVFLEQREPHSPTPYLIRRAVSWGDKNLADLVSEFSGDPSGLNQLTRLLGLDKNQPPPSQGSAPSSSSSNG